MDQGLKKRRVSVIEDPVMIGLCPEIAADDFSSHTRSCHAPDRFKQAGHPFFYIFNQVQTQRSSPL
jgi:hypothetical protein